MKKLSSLVALLVFTICVYSQTEPDALWQQHYGSAENNQSVNSIANDEADNLFVAGYVFTDETHCHLMVNKYTPNGKLAWNNIYTNTVPSNFPDYVSVALPDEHGGVTIISTIHRQFYGRKQGHIVHYNEEGKPDKDYFFGDTTLGTTLITTQAIKNNQCYLLGVLNGQHQLFKIDTAANVIWNTPIYSNTLNYRHEQLVIDFTGQVFVASMDSALPQVSIRRYDPQTGELLLSFTVPLEARVQNQIVRLAVDRQKHIFLASKANDETGRPQLYLEQFDWQGKAFSANIYPSSHGHVSTLTSFQAINGNRVLIAGTYADNKNNVRFAEVDKIDVSKGEIVSSSVDSDDLVNDVTFTTDAIGNVYMETTKGQTTHQLNKPDSVNAIKYIPETWVGNYPITEFYTFPRLSISKFSFRDGKLLWNKNFDNENNIRVLRIKLNRAGDVFFACNTYNGQSGKWFAGRLKMPVYNNPGISNPAAISNITQNQNTLSIYPNPFNNQAHVAFTTTQTGTGWLKVYNISGQQLYEQEVSFESGQNVFPFNEQYAAGVYLFRLETAQGNFALHAVAY